MLYLPQHKLAFIHIPKNAGQAVRKGLMNAGELSFESFARDLNVDVEAAEPLMEEGVDIAGVGRVQPEHVPLAFLEAHFPESWQTLKGSRSFIFARPFRDRFFSALMQRLREYRGAGAIRADDPLVAEEAKNVCEWLDGRGDFAEMEYIHFSRQVDYANLGEERIVSAVFPLDRTDAAIAWVARETGLEFEVPVDHVRREPKKWAKSLQPAARFVGRKLMPGPIKRAIYPLWKGSGVFANAASRYASVSLGDDVEAFIADYYAPDDALYAEACAALAANDTTPSA